MKNRENIMETKNREMEFRSEVTTKFLGAGLTSINQISRQEAKSYLAQVESMFSNRARIYAGCVISFYLSNGSEGYNEETMARYLTEIKHDIKLMRQRLTETATESTKKTKPKKQK